MFFQRDYVLRMIEMLGDLLRRLRAMLREEDAYAELEEVSQRACGLPMEMLRTGEPEMLGGLLDEPQRYLAAELLMIAAEVDRRRETDDQLLPLFTQALSLYGSLTDPDYLAPACDRTARLLRDLFTQLPLESMLEAADLLERGGRYADAEDALFAAADRDGAYIPLLAAFYERLSSLDEKSLLAGGLSPDEIEEGKAALK